MNLVDRICEKLSSKLEKRIITRRNGSPYLERYYILHSRTKWIPGIYLHKFLSSDEDPELHSHPWYTSISFILSGSYLELRRMENEFGYQYIRHKIFGPGSFNLIRNNDFHRVELQNPYVWTLFISGNKEKDWGFWSRETGEYLPWRKHIFRKKREVK